MLPSLSNSPCLHHPSHRSKSDAFKRSHPQRDWCLAVRVLSPEPCLPRALRYCGAFPAWDERQDSCGLPPQTLLPGGGTENWYTARGKTQIEKKRVLKGTNLPGQESTHRHQAQDSACLWDQFSVTLMPQASLMLLQSITNSKRNRQGCAL